MNKLISILIISNKKQKENYLYNELKSRQLKVSYIDSLENIIGIIKQEKINQVLIDLTEDYTETIQTIKTVDPQIHITLLIDDFSNNNLYKFFNYPACNYIKKPFIIESLVNNIRKNCLNLKERYNKRKNIREHTTIHAEIITNEKNIETSISNISESGAFINTDFPFSIDDPIEIIFTLNKKTITISGKITWHRKTFKDGLFPGVGIQFDNIPQETQSIITTYIMEHKIDNFNSNN
jgi:Tfp pilus assembly protein PilZ